MYENFTQQKFQYSNTRSPIPSENREGWRSLKELAVFEATTYIRKYGRQLLEKSWCVQENSHDRYTAAVKRERRIIGHLPRKLSRLCLLFLRRGGAIFCTVTGGRRYSGDLPQGGLEVPCTLLFKHKPKEVHKIKKLLSKRS